MHLSNRLKCLAGNVQLGGVVADIGCDHGFTSIYLVQQGLVERAVAMDINKEPLKRAREHVIQYQMQDKISLRLSDGAKELSLGEADTLLISGMGGALICRILRDSEKVVKSAAELVLSPQSEAWLVRHCIHELGFQIVAEEMVKEQGKYYVIIRATKGLESYTQELDYIYGKKLVDGRDEVFLEFLQKEAQRVSSALTNMEGKQLSKEGEKKRQELLQIRRRIEYIVKRRVMGNHIKVTVGSAVKEYDSGITYGEIAKEFEKEYQFDIILAQNGGKLVELAKTVKEDAVIKFLTTATGSGHKTYERGVILLMLKAFYSVADPSQLQNIFVKHSLGDSIYCEAEGITITEELLREVQDNMMELVGKDLPFEKRSVETAEALSLFEKHRMYDKKKLFEYRRVSRVNIYSLDGFEDYYYGYMPASTGILKYFSLEQYGGGFLIHIPNKKTPDMIQKFHDSPKLFGTLQEASRWGKMVDVDTVGALNDVIAHGGASDLILVQEALQEKKIAEIAERIAKNRSKKFIMIAGPSSSGKTSFSHRLSIQLRTYGLKPHPIGLDNYFKNRAETPLDENGNYDFECLEAIDVEQFNQDMAALLRGERVELPSFNFVIGAREYRGDFRQLGPDDILVIEGIHGLNDKLSYSLPKESKFKIYISALTQINIDEHNRISTTDGRLIRRMVRDARTRGTSAAQTIARWPSVRRGENQYIFPYQEEADVMFNSALIYELAVLKPYAESILFGISKDAPEYVEAKRLLKFLDYFIGISSEEIPKNSLMREFVGGSVFKV